VIFGQICLKFRQNQNLASPKNLISYGYVQTGIKNGSWPHPNFGFAMKTFDFVLPLPDFATQIENYPLSGYTLPWIVLFVGLFFRWPPLKIFLPAPFCYFSVLFLLPPHPWKKLNSAIFGLFCYFSVFFPLPPPPENFSADNLLALCPPFFQLFPLVDRQSHSYSYNLIFL